MAPLRGCKLHFKSSDVNRLFPIPQVFPVVTGIISEFKLRSMANSNITSPHDRYFRLMMSNPKITKDFFTQHLPATIKSIVDLNTIEQQKDSFIDDKLKQQIADLLFSAKFGNCPGYLYILIEHQSTPDKLMPFRLLKYITAIMEHHLKKTKKSMLPIVYPMVFYTGKKNYKYSNNILDLFGDNKKIVKDILWSPYQLIDLSEIPDEKLKEQLLYGVFACMLKHAHEKNVVRFLKSIMSDLKTIANIEGIEYIYTILTYVVEAFDIPAQEFTDTIKTNLPFIEEKKIMTIAEQFRQEGYQKGRREAITIAEQFRQEGYQKGRHEGMTIAEQFRREGYQKGRHEAMTIAEQFRQEGYQKGRHEAMTIAEQFRQEGYQKGRHEGVAKGKLEAMKLVVIRLLNQGLAVEKISNITGLSNHEIKSLKSQRPAKSK